jgi:ankyrin repeat protein
MSAIVQAFQSGASLDSIRALLNSSETLDLNFQDTTGKTALIVALEQGSEEVALELLARGADIDLADHTLTSPLMFACEAKLLLPATLLASKVQSLEICNNQGLRAVHFAVGSLSVFLMLIGKGALDSSRIYQGQTVLHHAVLKGSHPVCHFLVGENPAMLHEEVGVHMIWFLVSSAM